MTNQSTIDKLIEMRLTSMADAFRNQLDDPKFKEIPFEDQFGMLVDIEYSNRNQWRITELAGSSVYKVDDDAWSIQVTDFPTVNDDEMMEFAANPAKFQWEKCIPR